MTRDEILAKAKAMGLLLYPTAVITDDSTSGEAMLVLNAEVRRTSGSYKWVREILASDLLAVVGHAPGDDDDQLADSLMEDSQAVFLAPEGYPHSDATGVLCFWSDDNPYPGIKQAGTRSVR